MKKTLGRDQVVSFAKTRTSGGRVAEGERVMMSSGRMSVFDGSVEPVSLELEEY